MGKKERTAYVQKRIADGWCLSCVYPNDRAPLLTCSRCAAAQRAKYLEKKLHNAHVNTWQAYLNRPKSLKERQAEWALEGLCLKCGAVVEPGFKRCEKCRRYHTNAAKVTKRKYRALGNCTCGKETIPGKSSCPKCHATKLLDSVKRKARLHRDGKCRCGRAKDPHAYRCPTCLANQVLNKKRRIARWEDQGKCTSCGRPKLMGETTKQCRLCIEKGEFNFTWN